MKPVYEYLLSGLKSYRAGSYEKSASLFDRLLARASSPPDSQLVFIGLYYGIRSRLAVDRLESADSLYNIYQELVPEAQQPELEIVLGLAAPAMEKEEGPYVPEALAKGNKIGVVLPLSGKFREFGQAILEGVELAADEYNHSLGSGSEVVLEVHDDCSDPVSAAALGRNLAADSTVVAIIGSYEDETSLSLSLVAAAHGIPLVCPTADAVGLDDIGPMVHVLNRTEPEMVAKLAWFAVKKLKLQVFGILASDAPRGNLLASAFADAVRASGGVVVSDQRYTSQTSTFENQMCLFSRYLPDALFLPAKSDQITQLASQVYYFGLETSCLLGTEYWDSERVIRLGGRYVDGAVFSSPFYEHGEGLRWNEFKDLYERTYRRPVNRYSALGYDAAGLIIQAAEGSFPVDRKQLAGKLNRETRGYRGAMAVYSMDDDGRVKRKSFILELSGGNVVPAEVDLRPEGEVPGNETDSLPENNPPQPGAGLR